MAIISFWNDGEKETGQTSTIAAIATYLSIKNNYKTLLFNTKHDDSSLQNCFWEQKKNKKNMEFMLKNRTDIATGTSGVAKAILSNKTSPEIVKNYTKTIFKNRLEILTEEKTSQEDYEIQRKTYKEIAKISNKYYNLVFVDLTGSLEDSITRSILEISDLIIVSIPQNLKKINDYYETKQTDTLFDKNKTVVLIGKCDKQSKYNAKNVSRYMNIKDLYPVPYSTQFLEATSEGKVDEYFMKYRAKAYPDENTYFIQEIENISTRILEKIKELQMRT